METEDSILITQQCSQDQAESGVLGGHSQELQESGHNLNTILCTVTRQFNRKKNAGIENGDYMSKKYKMHKKRVSPNNATPKIHTE